MRKKQNTSQNSEEKKEVEVTCDEKEENKKKKKKRGDTYWIGVAGKSLAGCRIYLVDRLVWSLNLSANLNRKP